MSRVLYKFAAWAVVACAAVAFGVWRFVPRTTAPSATADGACVKHALPLDECPFCTPALIEKLGWCAGHDVAEALCTRCNAKLISAFKAENDWCAEHALPESQCLACHPELANARRTGADADPHDGHDHGPGEGERHGSPFDLPERPLGGLASDAANTVEPFIPVSEPPRRSRAPSVTCSTDRLRVRFTSAEIARRAGLRIERVTEQPFAQNIVCNARLDHDRNHYSEVSSRVPGVITEVRTDLGERVEAGDVLALVDSADLAAAKAEFLQSVALVALWERNHDREHDLLARGLSSERADFEAETTLAEQRIALARAEQRLRTLGLSAEHIAAVRQHNDTTPVLAVSAPFRGEVVERHAVVGEMVSPGAMMFSIADTTRVWALIDVQEHDIQAVSVGQSVVLALDALRGESFPGVITWLSAAVDARTRTLQARAVIDNPDGRLRANMYGRALVNVRDRQTALLIPKDAVQWDGCCNLAFVAQSDTLFEPRKLRLGPESQRAYVVLEGLRPGDPVVTQGSFLLKAEILRNNIGAGCCEVEHLDK